MMKMAKGCPQQYHGEPIVIRNDSNRKMIGYRRWDEIYLIRNGALLGLLHLGINVGVTGLPDVSLLGLLRWRAR